MFLMFPQQILMKSLAYLELSNIRGSYVKVMQNMRVKKQRSGMGLNQAISMPLQLCMHISVARFQYLTEIIKMNHNMECSGAQKIK